MLIKSRRDHAPQIMIIPMIDIMFFLLVFFMMSTLYMTDQQTIPVNLPAASSSQPDPIKSVKVTVTQDRQLYVGQEKMSLAAVKSQLQQEARRGEVSVVLAADREVDYGDFIGVMDELKTAGIKRISLAARHGQER